MKRLFALVLTLVLLLGMAACGAINKTEVSVLWSGEGEALVPDSLTNALERAMYIEKIEYAHYGAEGDQAKQVAQIQKALDKNCAGLVVELVEDSAAQAIVDMVKAKDVPVVFINSNVEKTVVDSYAKCVCVTSDEASVATVLGKKIAESISKKKDYEKADLDKNGKITFLALGNVSGIADAVNAVLKEVDRNAIVAANAASLDEVTVTTEVIKKTEYGRLKDKDGAVIEMIISDSDVTMLNDLVSLQGKGFNADKLNTHFVPVYTVGADADYKAYVFSKIPAITTALDNDKLDKEEAISEELIEEIRGYSNLVNFSVLEKWQDLDVAIYTTRNVIEGGRISNAAAEDLDGLAGAAAKAIAKLLKGKELDSNSVQVAYTTIQ